MDELFDQMKDGKNPFQNPNLPVEDQQLTIYDKCKSKPFKIASNAADRLSEEPEEEFKYSNEDDDDVKSYNSSDGSDFCNDDVDKYRDKSKQMNEEQKDFDTLLTDQHSKYSHIGSGAARSIESEPTSAHPSRKAVDLKYVNTTKLWETYPEDSKKVEGGRGKVAFPIITLYQNEENATDHGKLLFQAGALGSYVDGTSINRNSLRYVIGDKCTTTELTDAGPNGVEVRYRFKVIALQYATKEQLAELKNSGEQFEEGGVTIIKENKCLLDRAIAEAKAIGQEKKKSAYPDIYIVTPSKNDNTILGKYISTAILKDVVGQTWAEGGYNTNLKLDDIKREGINWKDKVCIRRFSDKADLKNWLQEIKSEYIGYDDIEPDNERLKDLFTTEKIYYHLYKLTEDIDINIDEEALSKVLREDGITKYMGTFDTPATIYDKLGVSSSGKRQDIRNKLKEAGLRMEGHGRTPKTWANGKKEAEEANCLFKVGDLTYLVRGSELN